ncbi:hypothetical protein K378_00238 [Streptomyces sp. Amel2xB2]|nr:hypothetical protein K378_00238 [Streptomyces sp. Amel2xB2]
MLPNKRKLRFAWKHSARDTAPEQTRRKNTVNDPIRFRFHTLRTVRRAAR